MTSATDWPEFTFPADEAAVVRRAYMAANVILEYGSGGSTVLASSMPGKTIFSVESDKSWATRLQSHINKNDMESPAKIFYSDIGSTGAWGRPVDSIYWHRFHNYPLSIWSEPSFKHPDVVLIDGRFRAACMMAVLLYAKRPVRVLFDDYTDRKPYHVVEQWVTPLEAIGRMAIFQVTPGLVSHRKIESFNDAMMQATYSKKGVFYDLTAEQAVHRRAEEKKQENETLAFQNITLESNNSELKSDVCRTRRENERLEHKISEAQVRAKTATQKIIGLEEKLSKYRARLKKVKMWGLILGAPMILLLSPILALGVAIVFAYKRFKNAKSVLSLIPKYIVNRSSQHYNPAELDKDYTKGVLPKSAPIRHLELVSVIMPSYNNEKWLARALHSALSQEGVEVEVIFIDDGSTDGSVRLAQKIAQSYPNLKVVSLLRNFGCYYARNLGVMNSNGEFITVLDTDDIMAPDRIVRQLDALKKMSGSVACRCFQRRWTSDYSIPLSDMKFGENSLVWRREVIEKIGWYDTVRYSGDAEFRLRLENVYGSESVIKIPDELYYTRALEGSLTTNNNGRVFTHEEGNLTVAISAERKAYAENFSMWHKKHRCDTYMRFPQLCRPFRLGIEQQNASPSLEQRRIGMMASFPARKHSLKDVLTIILPQLDELRLYLNDYDEIPDFVRNPKIQVVLGKNAQGDLRDNGKFYDLPTDDKSYIFTLDDDLNYPDDYVARMVHQIEMLGRACVCGVHGVIFPFDNFTKLDQREVFHFKDKSSGNFVDLLGTGTTAWHSSVFCPSLDEFATKGTCDLWFAAAAAKRNVPLFAVPRGKNWLTEYVRHDESLYLETVNYPQNYFETYNAAIAPILREGNLRRKMLAHLSRCYGRDTLAAAGIATMDNHALEAENVGDSGRPTTYLQPLPSSGKAVSRTSSGMRRQLSSVEEDLHFHIVVNGWNCWEYFASCLRSIAQQSPADYTFDVTLIDDESTDGTFESLVNTVILPTARLIRITENTGPAHARHVGISSIEDPDTIVVLLDMDDALESNALRTVANCYRQNPHCLMTIGNWHDQLGRVNPQRFYTDHEIDNQRIRDVELFNAGHLRTFRRHLYDAVEVSDLLDQQGKWLETCTDVAIMYPLLDQCYSTEVEFIHQPIYRYTAKHSSGTLARFGKPHKIERLEWLKSKTPKKRE